MSCYTTPETLKFYLCEEQFFSWRKSQNGNKIIKKRYFGGMSSMVLASNRIISRIFVFISVGLHSCVWVCLQACALIQIDITINLYTYAIASQACSRVCVCAMCIGRLGTPLCILICNSKCTFRSED